MHVAALQVSDFRSYTDGTLNLGPGRVALIGANGQGKTNLVEAIDYLSSMASHRVSSDAPLVRHGAERAQVTADVVKFGRTARLQVEIRPGATNRAWVNGAQLPRARDLIGTLRTVVFSPEDLALIKGDPGVRRHFLDTVGAVRTPRLAGVRADYDRVLKQRNALLKSARQVRRGEVPSTLEVWDEHLTEAGAALMEARLQLIHDLAPYLDDAYRKVAALAAQHRQVATATYSSRTGYGSSDRSVLQDGLRAQLEERRRDELDRGLTLVGPHRDDLTLTLGELPAKGYASHGETWSFALALRLATFDLLRDDGDDPVLILDDVFAELDRGRREQLSELVADIEQVMITAAVADDVPASFADQRIVIDNGSITHEQ